MIDCTPDFPAQLRLLAGHLGRSAEPAIDGMFLTHAHIGHYTGLIHLGKEAMSASGVPLYVMPRMCRFQQQNQPWSGLVRDGHVRLNELEAGRGVGLSADLGITPVPVPHRDELSETVGYLVNGPARSALYIPDIDGWSNMGSGLRDLLVGVDLALLDGTFFDAGELPGRDLREIPHPAIVDTFRMAESLGTSGRPEIWLTHFNHTNPVLDSQTQAYRDVADHGLSVAGEGSSYPLG